MVALLVLFTILLFLTIDYFAQRAAMRRALLAGAVGTSVSTATPAPPVLRPAPDVGFVPAGVFVGPGHAWLRMGDGDRVWVGADPLPVSLLGDIDHAVMAAAGSEVRRGDPIAVIRRGHRSVAVASPVDGVVDAINPGVRDDVHSVASDPYGSGWLVRIEPRRLGSALRRMFVSDEAHGFMRNELRRLRDVLASIGAEPAIASATLPDGGLPVDGLAQTLPEDAWKELADRMFAIHDHEPKRNGARA